MLVSTALEGEADYIVTWDKALLSFGQYQHIRFVTPQEFIALLNQPSLPTPSLNPFPAGLTLAHYRL